MRRTLPQFLAVVLTALALVPLGSHLMALPNKIGLPEEAYFITQGIYRGWALSGVFLIGSLVALLAVAALERGRARAFALAGAGLMAASLAVFFAWTFPANQATENWTVVPPEWRDLRAQWEYSHAANALVVLAALCCSVLSVLHGRGTGAGVETPSPEP